MGLPPPVEVVALLVWVVDLMVELEAVGRSGLPPVLPGLPWQWHPVRCSRSSPVLELCPSVLGTMVLILGKLV